MVSPAVAAHVARNHFPEYFGPRLLNAPLPSTTPTILRTENDFDRWKENFVIPRSPTVVGYGLEPLPTIGLYGSTAVRPDGVVWRDEAIRRIERHLLGAGATDPLLGLRVFNPQLPPGVWTPEHGKREAEHALLDHAIVFGIEGKSTSVGSMLEVGFVALSVYLMQRRAFAFIDRLDGSSGVDDQRARGINILDAQYIERLVNRNFTMCGSLAEAVDSAFEAQIGYEVSRATGRNSFVSWTLLRDAVLNSEIVVSGSSKSLTNPEKLVALAKLNGCPYYDTALPADQWNLELYEREELPRKHDAVVNLLLVTNPGSKGALANVGTSVFRAALQDSVAVIYLPERSEGDAAVRDYRRARSLTLAHWDEVRSFVPWLNNNVVFTDNAELAGRCAEEAFKLRTGGRSSRGA